MEIKIIRADKTTDLSVVNQEFQEIIKTGWQPVDIKVNVTEDEYIMTLIGMQTSNVVTQGLPQGLDGLVVMH